MDLNKIWCHLCNNNNLCKCNLLNQPEEVTINLSVKIILIKDKDTNNKINKTTKIKEINHNNLNL